MDIYIKINSKEDKVKVTFAQEEIMSSVEMTKEELINYLKGE